MVDSATHVYTDFFISSFYQSNSTIDVVINGDVIQVPFSDTTKLKWKVELCPEYDLGNNVVNATEIPGHNNIGYITMTDDKYDDIIIKTELLVEDKPVLLTCVYVDEAGIEHDVIRCLYYKNMN